MILLSTLILLTLALQFPVSVSASEDPRWSIALRGMQNEMQTDNWETTYSDKTNYAGIEIGWKFLHQLGINLGISYSRSTGKATTTSGRTSNDNVRTRLAPVEISCFYRLVFMKDQIVVPYAAAGYTHMFYQTDLNDDERIGDQSGYHLKAGLQFLLDWIEPAAAARMKQNWGLENSSLFVEYYQSEIDDFGSATDNLGAKGIAGGLIFEF